MATFAQQPQAITAAGFPQHYHRSTHSTGTYTPPSSTTPPSTNISPSHAVRGMYQAKPCSYVPAAFRPTELPSARNKRPLTPPRSAHSSLDSQHTRGSFGSGASTVPVSPIDEDNVNFISPIGSVSRVVTDEWNEELGNVTGVPTRNHWKPDSTASCCTSPTCTTVFSFLARRHHCRRCGGIFCTSHSTRYVPLDQEARFHPSGSLSRACEDCWSDFQIWTRDRKSRASSIASGDTATQYHPQQQSSSGLATPTMEVPGAQGKGSDLFAMGVGKDSNGMRRDLGPVQQGQESVQGDWNWSTF